MVPTPPPDPVTPADRVAWLLLNVWSGNVRRMALDLGVSHSVISKIANGRQGPGQRVLAAVAAHPKVNPIWVYEGQGEPLLAADQGRLGECRPVPIARVLLPGPPADHRGMLTGMSFPVAAAFCDESSYFYEVPQDHPIVGDPERKVATGDLLLMYTDSRVWRGNRELLHNKMVVARVDGDGRQEYELARWDLERAVGLVPYTESHQKASRKHHRHIDVDGPAPAEGEAKKTIENVLAVLMLIIRIS